MNGLGDLVLTGTGFTGYEDRGLGMRHKRQDVENFLHLCTVADYIGGAIAIKSGLRRCLQGGNILQDDE